MKKSTITLIVFSLSMFVVLVTTLNAQVTIGSNISPIEGSLLDLKEYMPDASNATSTKGLGMPRVELTKKGTLADIILDPKPEDANKYIGLIVYNTTISLTLCPGLYVWNDSEWMPLAINDEKADIKVTDGDGNLYDAKWFGSPCLGTYWMTRSLRTTKDMDGSPLSSAAGTEVMINPGKNHSINGAVLITDKSGLADSGPMFVEYRENNVDVKDTYHKFADKFGLLYNWYQAQIACPKDWRLSTPNDWALLGQYLDFEEQNGNFVDMGKYFKSNSYDYQANDDTIIRNWDGEDKANFNVYPAGNVRSDKKSAEEFGKHCYFWTTATGVDATKGVDYGVDSDASSFYRGEGNLKGDYYSVRCVKD